MNELQMGDRVTVVVVAIRLAGGGKCIEARPHGFVADGMDMHSEARSIELRD